MAPHKASILSRRRVIVTGLAAACLIAAIASSQGGRRFGAMGPPGSPGYRDLAKDAISPPETEFHMGRMIYRTSGGGGSHGFWEPWWAIDYPEAEDHFLVALRRMTSIEVSQDSRHLEITNPRVFQYPWIWLQQPGRGYWNPNDQEAAALREYLLRGGFMVVDDFHARDWEIFEPSIKRVFPDRPIVAIPEGDSLMHTFFDLPQGQPLPGRRHLMWGDGRHPRMEGASQWRGIYDDDNRLMVAMNYNMDMGDSWEHADDPEYPMDFTGLGYRLGVNYIVYAMTH